MALSQPAIPREQVMCVAVSCGSAAADRVGLAEAVAQTDQSLISAERRFLQLCGMRKRR